MLGSYVFDILLMKWPPLAWPALLLTFCIKFSQIFTDFVNMTDWLLAHVMSLVSLGRSFPALTLTGNSRSGQSKLGNQMDQSISPNSDIKQFSRRQ